MRVVSQREAMFIERVLVNGKALDYFEANRKIWKDLRSTAIKLLTVFLGEKLAKFSQNVYYK